MSDHYVHLINQNVAIIPSILEEHNIKEDFLKV